MTDDRPVQTEAEIRDWIVERLVNQIGIDPEEIDLDRPVVGLGVDSMHFVVLVGELEQWLGVRFQENPLIDYPTINGLSGYLARQVQQGRTLIDPNSDS
jgi:acyl carrier protein